MAVIKVPKTPKKAFDASRRPSVLLLGQIAHLEWAALPASQRKPHQLPGHTVGSEGQAAERIRQLTEMILTAKGGDAAAAVAVAVRLPPLAAPVKVRTKPAKQRARASRPSKSRVARSR